MITSSWWWWSRDWFCRSLPRLQRCAVARSSLFHVFEPSQHPNSHQKNLIYIYIYTKKKIKKCQAMLNQSAGSRSRLTWIRQSIRNCESSSFQRLQTWCDAGGCLRHLSHASIVATVVIKDNQRAVATRKTRTFEHGDRWNASSPSLAPPPPSPPPPPASGSINWPVAIDRSLSMQQPLVNCCRFECN